MTNHSENLHSNRLGRYFVDGRCICCGICTLSAPTLLAVDLEREIGYVSRQPDTEQEERAIKVAMINCPVQAITIQGGLS